MDKNTVLSRESCLREASRCIGCGTCLTTCPVYGEDAQEQFTARGRNANLPRLFEEAEKNGLSEAMSKCLLCGRCALVCPRGIHNDRIVAALRECAVAHHGLPFAKKTVFKNILANRKLMGSLLKTASFFQGILPKDKDVFCGDGEIRHLPPFISALMGNRNVPVVKTPYLSERVAEVTPAAKELPKPVRVAFFAGCAMEFVLPESGVAIVDLLSKLGMEVVLPKEQGCCGIAVHVNGDKETALKMAVHNLEVLEACNADYIVTACATCGSSLRDMWPTLECTEDLHKRFVALAAKTKDFSELLMDFSFPEPFPYVSKLPENAKVTWHTPCHLAQQQKVYREPLTLLQRTLGERFEPLPSRCCGFGGSFNVVHYDISKAIAENKARDLKASTAQYVVTDCPGCMIQLSDLAVHHNIPCKVIHLAEAITLK